MAHEHGVEIQLKSGDVEIKMCITCRTNLLEARCVSRNRQQRDAMYAATLHKELGRTRWRIYEEVCGHRSVEANVA